MIKAFMYNIQQCKFRKMYNGVIVEIKVSVYVIIA